MDEYFCGKGQSEKKFTESFRSPSWNGKEFLNPKVQDWWEEYPKNLKSLVLSELASGNTIASILRNHNRNLILVGLGSEPKTNIEESPDILWHKTGQYGNYLYDGTSSTIEDVKSGCFISFVDSEYEID